MHFSEKRADKQATLFQDELHFLKKMEEGTRHTADGHYEMPLPFRSNTPKLPNNKSQALCRLKRLKTRMENDIKYRQDYMAFMQDIIEKGFLKGYHTNNDPMTMEGRGTSPITECTTLKSLTKSELSFCSATFMSHSLYKCLFQDPDL